MSNARAHVTNPFADHDPVVSSDTAACDTPGSEPVPQPLLSGEIGDPSDPLTYVKYYADVRIDGAEVTVCAKFGNEGSDDNLASQAVTVTVPDGGDLLPDVTFAPYTGGAPLPAPAAHPDPGEPSAACQNAATGTVTQVLNLSVDGVHTWLYGHTDTDLAVACVRTDGLADDEGGAVLVDTSGFPGVEPVTNVEPGVDPHDPDGPCPVQIVHNDTPVTLDVHRSATGELPAALCAQIEASSAALVLGFTGDPAATPSVTFMPDS